jgi:hypothetical protein
MCIFFGALLQQTFTVVSHKVTEHSQQYGLNRKYQKISFLSWQNLGKPFPIKVQKFCTNN